MEVLQTVLLVVQVFVAITLIGFILIQHGKGADAGAAFGSGASSTVFGSQGSGNFLTKVTTVLAVAFLLNSLALGYLATKREAPASVMEKIEQVEQQAVQSSAQQEPNEVPDDMMPTAPESTSSSDVPTLPGN